jgi:hypothetical protein
MGVGRRGWARAVAERGRAPLVDGHGRAEEGRDVPGGNARGTPDRHRARSSPPSRAGPPGPGLFLRRCGGTRRLVHAVGSAGRRPLDRRGGRWRHLRERARGRRAPIEGRRGRLGPDARHRAGCPPGACAPGPSPVRARRRRCRLRHERGRRRHLAVGQRGAARALLPCGRPLPERGAGQRFRRAPRPARRRVPTPAAGGRPVRALPGRAPRVVQRQR